MLTLESAVRNFVQIKLVERKKIYKKELTLLKKREASITNWLRNGMFISLF